MDGTIAFNQNRFKIRRESEGALLRDMEGRDVFVANVTAMAILDYLSQPRPVQDLQKYMNETYPGEVTDAEWKRIEVFLEDGLANGFFTRA